MRPEWEREALREMALPAAWLITPSKTEMFTSGTGGLERWLGDAAKALERASVR
jgi:hypothetical protein